jgi:hypothetical protein
MLTALSAVSCSHAGLDSGRGPASGPELGASACLASPSTSAGASHPSLQDRVGQIAWLRDSIERSLTQTEPNDTYKHGSGPDHVFNGNIDWHSSVHAHWALLSMARATHDAALEARVLQRLTPAAFAAEAARLAQSPPDPAMELPYGQGWLLMLFHELDRHPGSAGASPEGQALRRATEERVLAYLEHSAFPEGKRGGLLTRNDPSYFSREHTSWLFAYWLLKLSQPSEVVAERFARLSARVEAQHAALLKQTVNGPKDFLYLPAVLWLVDHAAPVGEPQWAYAEPLSPLPSRPVTTNNAHQSGAVMVSLWPYAVQSALGDRASCEHFNAVFDRLISQPEYWRFDPATPSTFVSVGHWIPQFMWMGILLEQGMI